MNDANDLESSGVPLSDMIEKLRAELQESMQRGAGQTVAFAIDKAELQLKVAVSQKGKAGAGIAFWVVKAEAGIEGQRDFAHTFKLTLRPVSGTTGAPINIAALMSHGQAPSNN
jgi:Trypsin-co-occurring domain 2